MPTYNGIEVTEEQLEEFKRLEKAIEEYLEREKLRTITIK